MNEFQFCIIILAGGPALICFVLLLTMLFDYLLDRKSLKDEKMKSSTWCCVKGDFVIAKECDGECETCKHFVTVDDLR